MKPDEPENTIDLRGVKPEEILLVRKMFDNPEGRAVIEQTAAKLIPGAKDVFPHLRINDALTAAKAELDKARDEVRAEREAEKREAKLAAERRKIMEDPALRIREHEIAEVEKIMTERLMGRHEDAARALRSEQQVGAPRSVESRTWSMPGQEPGDAYFEALWKTGPTEGKKRDALALNEAYKMFDAFRRGAGHRDYADLMA